MKTMFVLSAIVAMTGCASAVVDKVQPQAVQVAPVMTVNDDAFIDVPLKLMSPSQSAARVN